MLKYLPELLIAVLLSIALLVASIVSGDHEEILQFQIQLAACLLLLGFSYCLALYQKKKFWFRPYLLSAILLSLYLPIGRLGMLLCKGETIDALLAGIDYSIFGVDLNPFLQQWRSPIVVEFFAYPYAFFIPYIHLSLLLNFVGQKESLRESRLRAFAVLYTCSFLGYLFLPACGPGEFASIHNEPALVGGPVYGLVKKAVAASGGMLGAFPSLHIGASIFFCCIDWSRDRLRAVLLLPVISAIAAATLILRFHYFIDLVVGLSLGLFCAWLAQNGTKQVEKISV